MIQLVLRMAMVYLITNSHLCSTYFHADNNLVITNINPKLPVLTLTLYFKIQAVHIHCSLGNILRQIYRLMCYRILGL